MYILPNIQYNKNINNLIFLLQSNNNNNNTNNTNNNNIINKSYCKYITKILRTIKYKTYNPYNVNNNKYYNVNFLNLYYQMVEIIKINFIIKDKYFNENTKYDIYHINNIHTNSGYHECINNYNLELSNNHSYHFDNIFNNNIFNDKLYNIIENIKNKNTCKYNLVIANYVNDINRHNKYNNNLLYQLSIALTLQKFKGSLLFKIYNPYDVFSCELIYLLSMLYKEVSLFKPTNCCYINGEIFIICKFFKLHNADNIVNNIIDMLTNNKNTIKILNFNIPFLFINKIEEYNAIFGQNRIETINNFLIEENINKIEQIKLNYSKITSIFCKKLNIKYL
jgi:23S rRNA U2552 (ribose-2'-O)-methylase RlmE/FtsJ